jgi:hypothetical protein
MPRLTLLEWLAAALAALATAVLLLAAFDHQ